MRAQDLWDRLPSVQEIVDHPRVRDVVARASRSATLVRVRRAVEDLAGEAARRAADLQSASPGELFERLVQRLQRPHVAGAGDGVINATGVLWGAAGQGPPLAPAALEAIGRIAASYAGPSAGGAPPSPPTTSVQHAWAQHAWDHSPAAHTLTAHTLTALVGAERSLVAANPVSMLAATLSATAGRPESGRGVVVSRAEVGEVADGVRLADLASTLGLRVYEVGASDGAAVADYAAGCEALRGQGASTPVVLRRVTERYEVIGGADRATDADLARAVHRLGGVVIEDLAGSAPVPTPFDLGVPPRSASMTLAAGADLVLLRGDGLVGGPFAGLLAGSAELVASVAGGVWGATLGVAPALDAALEASLSLFQEPDRLPFVSPVWGLVTAPLENLRTRAERLAPQLAASPLVESAEAAAIDPSAARPRGAVRLPSYAVVVTPRDESALREAIAAPSPPLVGRWEGGKLWLNLRTVEPRQDLALIAAIMGDAPPLGGAQRAQPD